MVTLFCINVYLGWGIYCNCRMLFPDADLIVKEGLTIPLRDWNMILNQRILFCTLELCAILKDDFSTRMNGTEHALHIVEINVEAEYRFNMLSTLRALATTLKIV